jgi:predicted transcriptional regulator
MTIRLPEDVRDELEALSQELHLPQWRVIVDAIQAYRASHQQAKVGRRNHVR